MFNPFKLLFAVPGGKHSDIVTVIDQHLNEWKKDKNSFYYQRLNHWYEVREPARVVIPNWLIYAFVIALGIILMSLFWVRALHIQIKGRKEAEKEKDKLIQKLQNALDEIDTLRGILPVCSYCKKIRDDKGYWNQIESYISGHSQAKFSHSICPECMKKHYSENMNP